MKAYGKTLFSVSLFFLLVLTLPAHSSTPALEVVTTEQVSQVISYDQTSGGDSDITEAIGVHGENRTGVSRTGVELQDTLIQGQLNISNVENVGNHTLSSVNVTINETDAVDSWFEVAKPDYLMYDSSVDMEEPQGASETTFVISELRANDSLIIGFNITDGTYDEPVNFTEAYSDWRVMTGRDVNISLNISNNFDEDVEIYDIEVFKTPQLYESTTEGVDYAFFTYHSLRGEDSDNADFFLDDYERTVLNWTPNGGILDSGEEIGVVFNSTAPVNVSLNLSDSDDWSSWMNMGNISAYFKANGSLSGLNIKNVTGRPTAAMMSATKERTDEDGGWNATSNITNIAESPLDYDLRQISLWATKIDEYEDPGDQSSWVGDTTLFATEYGEMSMTTANATWFTDINLSSGTSIDNYTMSFNYSYVPVVWMTADFYLLDDGNQIYTLSETIATQDDDYLYIEEIYVLLGGYLMKATKSFTPLETDDANRYQVNITLENIGEERTPELVTVFDMLPEDFNPITFSSEIEVSSREMTDSSSIIRISDTSGDIDRTLTGSDTSDFVLGSSDSGEIESGPYSGYWGYHIDLNAFEPGSDGDGLYDSDLSESEVLIRYKMEGNHSLASIENAYIVGIDPIRLEGASPSQSVASRLAMSGDSGERVILVMSLLLSISILLMTFIINRHDIGVKR